MFLSSLKYYEKWAILGVILGIVAGLAATTFYLLLHLAEDLFIFHLIGMSYPRPLGEGGSLNFTFYPGRYYLIPLSTAIGGLISGLIVYTFAPEAEGHGTDAAIKAYHYLQGKVRWVVIPVKIIASAITIGSGGSAGREGPTAQFSAGVGSVIADLLHLSPQDRRIAVAVGIGAGIGTIFKTPIGGAILAAEILYKRDFEPEVLYPAIIASAIGYTIFGSIFGFTPVFGYYTGTYNPLRLPMYAVLGVVAGLLAIIYVKTFYGIHSFFKKLRIPNYIKPLIGGALTGLIALLAPEILATGYGWINLVEYERFNAFYSPLIPVLILIFLLPILKIVATSFSVGSGGSGGVFAPGLFIGAYIGASVGLLFHYFFPNIVPNIAPFVIIGMMAFFAAAGKVPVSVIIMVTEMTSSLQLLPGAMIASALAYLVSGDYTIYVSQLPTRRDSPAHKVEYEIPIMESLHVKDCEIKDIRALITDKVNHVVDLMLNLGFMSLPVTDQNNNFLGVVYLKDLERAKDTDVIGSYITKGSPYVHLDSTLEQALEVMAKNKARWVAVVEKGKFKGILTYDSIVEAYERELKQIREANK
ncbi:chloride channel protein [Sulfurisphaera tokodaii]|uniref:ClC family transporter n=2 Tax=Sulfurisphaera tokodaii TaxID=111955 RepID=Q96XV7_SULTO|nr:chloride channel protein [Sulfurisphaera tokodaii]BAB67520.1 ClC family transporter [Sulfurisphaera tokodaii str. 7]HII74059.1 chloride channel protein [Sulfurisphaera tokodaii]